MNVTLKLTLALVFCILAILNFSVGNNLVGFINLITSGIWILNAFCS